MSRLDQCALIWFGVPAKGEVDGGSVSCTAEIREWIPG